MSSAIEPGKIWTSIFPFRRVRSGSRKMGSPVCIQQTPRLLRSPSTHHTTSETRPFTFHSTVRYSYVSITLICGPLSRRGHPNHSEFTSPCERTRLHDRSLTSNHWSVRLDSNPLSIPPTASNTLTFLPAANTMVREGRTGTHTTGGFQPCSGLNFEPTYSREPS